MKTKEEIAKTFFELFTDNKIPDSLLNNYLNDIDGQGTMDFQIWIISNMKDTISWCTGIGIIESFEHCYKVSFDNGNINNI